MNNHKDPQKTAPPKWADDFLQWFCSEELLEEIQGDLVEAYHERAAEYGRSTANRLFIKDVLLFFKPYAFEKYSDAKQFLPMFDNYLKIAIRNILHRKGLTTINLLGLSVGISAVLLISFYLNYELTYDQSFPENEQIYRLMNDYRVQTYTNMRFRDYYNSSREVQQILPRKLKQYDEVKHVCQFITSQSDIGGGDSYYLEFEDQQFVLENALFTNTGKGFQELFPQTFILGTPSQAFGDWQKIVLTEKIAELCFGPTWRQQDIIGKQLTLADEAYELGGVIAEMPGNTHFNFDFIVHRAEIPSWGAYIYLKLKPEGAIRSVLTKLNAEIDQIFPGYTEDELSKGVRSISLTDIHFTGGNLYELKEVVNLNYLYTFGLIALLILGTIWINYANLSVAMYADRQKEMAMRKVLGARAKDISFQLLMEAMLLSILCFPISWVLLWTLIPYLNELMSIELGPSIMLQWRSNVMLLSLLLIIGFASGIYPAILFSRKPTITLFGKRASTVPIHRRVNLKDVLLTTQFVIVVGLLSITLFIYQQMEYVRTKDLGFQTEGVMYFGLNGQEKYQQIRTQLMKLPETQSVGANSVPGSEMFNQLTYKMKDTDYVYSDGTYLEMDYGALKTLGIDCDACHLLDEGKDQVFIINQTAAEKLAKVKGGSIYELIGETLISEPEWENEEFGYGIPYNIEGIIDDYKFFSLKYPNQPLLMTVYRESPWVYVVLVKAKTDHWPTTISSIKKAYLEVESELPFTYTFLDDHMDELYKRERRSGILLGTLSFVVIVLALIGLGGIVSYIATSREKEIGIRKVLGASVSDILYRLNKRFFILMGMATALALPVSILLSLRWLENFAYHIDPNPWWVLSTGITSCLIVVIIVTLQGWKAAHKHPIETLRTD